MKVALLGTGTMGAGLARRLHETGHDVTVWNRTRSRAEPLAGDGIRVADSVADAVTDADVVQTIVFDLDSVLAVSGELVAALAPDAVWLQSTTVGPAGMRTIAERASSDRLVDAPVLGTKEPAAQGKLTVLVSGPDALIDRAGPVLDAIGVKTLRVGPELGSASALKLACNAWVASVTAATAQSLSIASALGVDGALFLEAIKGGAVDSPYAQLKGAAMLAGNYAPSFAIDGLSKDLALMLDATSGTAAAPELLYLLADLYATASKHGHGGDDIAAIRAVFDDS